MLDNRTYHRGIRFLYDMLYCGFLIAQPSRASQSNKPIGAGVSTIFGSIHLRSVVTPCKTQTERNEGYSTEVNNDRASILG